MDIGLSPSVACSLEENPTVMWLFCHCPLKKSSGSEVPFALFPSPVPWVMFHITHAVTVYTIISR